MSCRPWSKRWFKRSCQERKQEEAYWLNHRSLNVGPVQGEDASAARKVFLIQKLKFSQEGIKDLGKDLVKRMREPIAKARKEVFCTFDTKKTRDVVKAASKNLAGEGRGAGVCAQFSNFLLETFRTLETIGFHLRANDASVRRSVKFDDTALELDWTSSWAMNGNKSGLLKRGKLCRQTRI